MSEPVWTYQIQYYIKTGESGTPAVPTYTLIDYDNSFNPTKDINFYEPTYKARQNQPKWATSVKTSIEFDIDIVESEALQTYFKDNEDILNVETEIVRVWAVGTEPQAGYAAKKATFVMNQNPIDGEAGSAIHATGTLDMTSDGWTAGTFKNGAFTPSV